MSGLLHESILPMHNNFSSSFWKHFRSGVRCGAQSTLLKTLFSVRVNGLFEKLNRQEKYCYLSGLVIGSEANCLKTLTGHQIIVCCQKELLPYYLHAIEELGLAGRTYFDPPENYYRNLIKAHIEIAKSCSKGHLRIEN